MAVFTSLYSSNQHNLVKQLYLNVLFTFFF